MNTSLYRSKLSQMLLICSNKPRKEEPKDPYDVESSIDEMEIGNFDTVNFASPGECLGAALVRIFVVWKPFQGEDVLKYSDFRVMLPPPASPETSPDRHIEVTWTQIRCVSVSASSRVAVAMSSNSVSIEKKCSKQKIPHVLSVAGSDSGGGAGIQADLKTYGARGIYCFTVITAVTAPNTIGVQGVNLVPEEFVAEQLRSVLTDMQVDVVSCDWKFVTTSFRAHSFEMF
ncbi:hypothetical protein MKW98_014572 [Papaver atlanticum]|uniref:Pyridoxamine kinase/Phosphomethylpyrimidine kinase domain-containing protein n=1 Tax=Papaver atlanticum TaxID=357466 RepID=A0AAD4SH55_9MAGN|nr:hypothetical protein MKW98_014572 [Papaver atlanticum]